MRAVVAEAAGDWCVQSGVAKRAALGVRRSAEYERRADLLRTCDLGALRTLATLILAKWGSDNAKRRPPCLISLAYTLVWWKQSAAAICQSDDAKGCGSLQKYGDWSNRNDRIPVHKPQVCSCILAH